MGYSSDGNHGRSSTSSRGGVRGERNESRGDGRSALHGREGGARRAPRPVEPELPEDLDRSVLDKDVRRDLLSLDKANADAVTKHLVMAQSLLDADPQRALEHARAARKRAGRVAVVREAAGIAAYRAEQWSEAISELRASRRMGGGPGLVSVLADCERALARPERALELVKSPEGRSLTGDEAVELRIVAAGARRDLGQFDAAVVLLQIPELDASRTGSAATRLFYAYADALLAAGRPEDATKWFLTAAAADEDEETDAEERVAELGEPSFPPDPTAAEDDEQ